MLLKLCTREKRDPSDFMPSASAHCHLDEMPRDAWDTLDVGDNNVAFGKALLEIYGAQPAPVQDHAWEAIASAYCRKFRVPTRQSKCAGCYAWIRPTDDVVVVPSTGERVHLDADHRCLEMYEGVWKFEAIGPLLDIGIEPPREWGGVGLRFEIRPLPRTMPSR